MIRRAIKWTVGIAAVITALPVIAYGGMYLFAEILWAVACSSGC